MGTSSSFPVRTFPTELTKITKRQRRKKSSYDVETKNEKLVLDNWCNAVNNQDMETIRQFATRTSCCFVKGASHAMPLPEFLEGCGMIFASFPDNFATWDSIKEIEPGVVFVQNYRGRGRHTGEPFCFGPYPPIKAKGVIVQEDPCHLTISITPRGRIAKLVINNRQGNLVGPPGYYNKLGGDLSAPIRTNYCQERIMGQ